MGEDSSKPTAIDLISQPLTLPCGLTLPNRLVKCPMQETLAIAPFFDPPIDKFENLYTQVRHFFLLHAWQSVTTIVGPSKIRFDNHGTSSDRYSIPFHQGRCRMPQGFLEGAALQQMEEVGKHIASSWYPNDCSVGTPWANVPSWGRRKASRHASYLSIFCAG